MKDIIYKKKLVLVPSAYNSKVMGDIENFIPYYKNDFDVYVISDKYEEDEYIEDDVNYIRNDNPLANYLKITADYIIDAGSVNGFSKFCDSQKRVSVWHGIPYKNMFVKLDPKYFNQGLEYSYGYDLMVSPSKFYSEKFLRDSMLYNGEILETAISRTDSLFISDEEKEKIKDELDIPKDKKILLYAPTFREKGKFNLPFEVDKLKELLPDDWVLVTKLHYLNYLEDENDIIDCTSYSSVNNLLAISDFLITDYSSLFFDYSVLNKSAIFFQYDKEEYEENRGFMFDLEDYIDKKYIVTDINDFYSLIKDIDSINNNLVKIKNEFYPLQKENSTKELVEKLNFDSSPRKTRDIIFLVNQLNQIGGVHNFVLNLAKEFKEKYNSKIIVIGKEEFPDTNDDVYLFDKENFVDMKLCKETNPGTVKSFLQNTDGIIIGCQFGAFMSMQNYLKDKKTILMFHGDAKDIVNKTLYKSHLRTINDYLIYNYKKFLLLTQKNKDILYEAVNEDIKPTLGFIENGYDFSDRKNFYKKNGEFVAITRLDNDKNPKDIIKIFENTNLNPKFKVHVYGDGSLKKDFEKEIKELKLENRIILHGYCDNKDEMYKDKQGLIMTSLTEGLPYTILEAYKYGIPIYTYDSFTAVCDLIDSTIGRVVSKSNIDEYVKALNEDFEVNNSSFDNFISKFSNEEVVKKWKDLFDELDIEEQKTLENAEDNIEEKKKDKVSIFKRLKKKKKRRMKRIRNNLLKSDKKSKSDLYINLVNCKYILKNLFKKKNRPMVSIIVPFYNNLKTIDNTLKSIKKCGYPNYEVLVINDGSKEDPKLIVDKYKNIRYFYKENEGLGLTRNFGINNAKGKYVFFLDSDDEICKLALNHLVDYAEENNLDVTCGICRRVYYNTKSTSYWYRQLYKKKSVNLMNERYKILNDTISTSKLYKLDSLKKSNLKFITGVYEDVLFVGQVYNHFDRVGLIPNIVYTWYIYGENTSITTTNTIDNYLERINKFKTIFKDAKVVDKIYYMRNFTSHHLFIYIHSFNDYTDEEKRKIFDEVRKMYLENEKYINSRLLYSPFKKIILKLVLENEYDEFAKISSYISEDFKNKLKNM